MIELKKIRNGDVVSTKHQSIIVDRIEVEGENLAFYGKICNKSDDHVERQTSTDTSTLP